MFKNAVKSVLRRPTFIHKHSDQKSVKNIWSYFTNVALSSKCKQSVCLHYMDFTASLNKKKCEFSSLCVTAMDENDLGDDDDDDGDSEDLMLYCFCQKEEHG